MTDVLEQWCQDSRGAIERKAEALVPTADFSDVMRRAHALAPDVVDAAKLEEARELAPVVDIRSSNPVGEAEAGTSDLALAGFVTDAREAVQRKVDERRLAPIGEAPTPGVASADSGSPRRAAGWTAAVVLLAAGVFAWVSVDVQSLLAPTPSAADAEQALLLEDRAGSGGRVESAGPRDPAPASRPRAARDAQTTTTTGDPEPEAIAITIEPEPAAASSKEPRRRAGPSLAELADRAEAQWRAKDLKGATATLRTIVRRGGRSSAAEMAYADLFTLASQRSDRGARQRLWRKYLGKFPRGRFADDARAGLCRAAGSGSAAACWSKYLRDFPKGSFRTEAERHQGGAH